MGGIVGAVVGGQSAADQLNSANANRQQALGQWTGLSAPDIASQQLNMQQYGNAGDLSNQAEQLQQMGPSAMTQVQTDPRLMQAQMAALQQLQQTGQMGMTPAEHAALVQAQQNAASQAQAKSGQILNQFAARGMGGSGAELAAQLGNAQNQAQMLSDNSNKIAQSGQQNALQAIAQAGQLGGQMQGQQFGQQSAVAQARDYINQFNTQNAQNVSNTNTGLANSANQFNLMKNQNLQNMNTQQANQQQQYNKQLLQQQFNNQAALASGRAGQYNGIAQTQQQQAGNTANMWAGIGQGVDAGAGAAYNAYNNSGGGNQGFSEQEQNDYLNSGQGPGYGQGLSENEMAGGNSAEEGADADMQDAESIYGVE